MTGAITIIMGRATADPVIQQGKNSGSEYVSLDFAVSQRGQDGKEETMYYQCYFNSFLAQRLNKAGVHKGTGLLIYGDLEIHPYVYQQGQKAGQAGVNAKITVKDWQFTLSNKQEGAAANGPVPNGTPAQNMGNNTPSYGNQSNQVFASNNNMNAQSRNMNYQGMQSQQGTYQSNAYPPTMNGGAAPNYGTPQGSYPNDGFMNVPENSMGQLPFN